jgi:hypothetical protein
VNARWWVGSHLPAFATAGRFWSHAAVERRLLGSRFAARLCGSPVSTADLITSRMNAPATTVSVAVANPPPASPFRLDSSAALRGEPVDGGLPEGREGSINFVGPRVGRVAFYLAGPALQCSRRGRAHLVWHWRPMGDLATFTSIYVEVL